MKAFVLYSPVVLLKSFDRLSSEEFLVVVRQDLCTCLVHRNGRQNYIANALGKLIMYHVSCGGSQCCEAAWS